MTNGLNSEVISNTIESTELSQENNLDIAKIKSNLLDNIQKAFVQIGKPYPVDLNKDIADSLESAIKIDNIEGKPLSKQDLLSSINDFIYEKILDPIAINPRYVSSKINLLKPGLFKDDIINRFSIGKQQKDVNTKETIAKEKETIAKENETTTNKNEKFRTNIETTHPIIEKTKYLETYSQYLVDDQKVAQSDIAKSLLTISPDGTTWETMDAKYKDIAKFMYIAEQLGQKTPEGITDQDRDVVNIANEFLSGVDMPTIQLPSKPKLENQETVYKSQELMDIDISESISQSQNQIGKENSQKEYQKLLDSQTITNKRYPDRQKDIQEKVLDEFWTKQTDIVRNILENAMPTQKEELQSSIGFL